MSQKYLAIKDLKCITRIINIESIPEDVIYDTIIKSICEPEPDFEKSYKSCFYLSYNGKPLLRNQIKKEMFTNTINNVEWFTRVKGGFIKDVINFIKNLAKMFLFIPKFFVWLGALLIWIIRTSFFLIVLGLNFVSKDGIFGLVKFLVIEIIMAPVVLVVTFIKNILNWLGRNTVQALWGADNVPMQGEPSDQIITGCPGEKCYKTAEGTTPFSVIIATILCPPVGVFMEYGVTGWFNVLICAILTLVFYFPGLIYALILIYC